MRVSVRSRRLPCSPPPSTSSSRAFTRRRRSPGRTSSSTRGQNRRAVRHARGRQPSPANATCRCPGTRRSITTRQARSISIMKYRYSKFTGEDLDDLDLEELLSRLSDMLLSSGFDDPHGLPGDDGHSMQELHDAILEALLNGGLLSDETLEK